MYEKVILPYPAVNKLDFNSLFSYSYKNVFIYLRKDILSSNWPFNRSSKNTNLYNVIPIGPFLSFAILEKFLFFSYF